MRIAMIEMTVAGSIRASSVAFVSTVATFSR
jgi:hypothetical protein